jgi:signal transduction histidine kinase
VVLYVVAQHTLSSDVALLIDQQRFLSTSIILAVGGIAVGMGILVLSWNRRLDHVVKQKTMDLQSVVSSLESANEKLTEHDKMQKEFINIAAHELRTPVQPLLSIAEQLEEDLDTGVKEVKLTEPEIEMVARNAKRLARLTTDILEVSRIESGSVKLRKEPIDLKVKVKNVIEDSRSFIQDASKVSIISESSISEPIMVEADKPRVFEVLSNLVRNAIKFTSEGSIRVRLDKNEDYAVITVKDTGSGIDAEIMPRLFEKFATKSETGTGLGLFIAKSIVNAHGGKIWGQNNPDGKGASFTFTLPLKQIPAESQRGTNARDSPNV